MEKRPILSTPRAQLYGSIGAIAVVVLCGLFGASMLGEQLDQVRIEAEQARSVSWVRRVISDIDGAAVRPVAVSDRGQLGSAASASIVTLDAPGISRATAMKFVAPAGYNGDIWIAMAIDESGSITGLQVLSHQETPGFGDMIARADSSWIRSFLGRSLEYPESNRWQLRGDGGDIDGVSGATITASAVVASVYAALNYLDQTKLSAIP
jgi:RnfABCDGE-type electron transport complex G subunit